MKLTKVSTQLASLAIVCAVVVGCKGAKPTAVPAAPTVPIVPESTLLPQPTAEPATAAVSMIGTYSMEGPAADAASKKITLNLTADQTATMSTEFAGKAAIKAVGVWSQNGQSVAVVLNEQDGKPYSETIVFTLAGDTLSAVQYDTSMYGATGLTLKKNP